MSEILSAAQMRAVEIDAIESGDVSGIELMERAGRGVVEAIFDRWPDLAQTSHRAVVLCGPGNNGGDGFVIARLLKEWGWEVAVFLYGDAGTLPPDAKANYQRWCEMGAVRPMAEVEIPVGSSGAALVVDALFGTGLSRPLRGLEGVCFNLGDFVDLTRDGPQPVGDSFRTPLPKVVAVDIPSGFCADSGKFLGHESGAGAIPEAHLTVTFHRPKTGHFLGLCAQCCGEIAVASIGLGERPSPPDAVRLCAAPDPAALNKDGQGHKFSQGHALILSGGAGRTGAARLAARGALRVGAGLVTLGVPGEAMAEVAAQITAVMMREVVDTVALREMLEDARLNALCLGPGLGLGQAAADLVSTALAAGRSTVLDADALTHVARAPELFEALHADCILTPHGGEFARLFPEIAGKLDAAPTKGPAYSKVDAAREAAGRAGCVVLFKGADTVIAAPDGRCVLHAAAYERAAPWLATAGSGDVLAGILTGLLARGYDPMQAAETGAWLHVEAARAFGPGLIAEDLPEMLPKVFRDLGL